IAATVGGLSWIPGAALGAGLGVIVGTGTLFAPNWFAAPAGAPPPSSAPSAVIATASATTPPAASHSAAPEVAARASPAPLPPMPHGSMAAPSSTSSAPPDAEVDMLAQEVALLDRARAALASSPAQALALADEHAARFPHGKLGMEREMVAIDALRRLGR